MDAVTVDLSNPSRGVGTAGDAMGDTLFNIELVWGSMNNGDTFIAGPGADMVIRTATVAAIPCPTRHRNWASR